MDDHLVIAITFEDHNFNVKATCERSCKKVTLTPEKHIQAKSSIVTIYCHQKA